MYNCPQQVNLGEKNIIPDPLKMNKDLLLEEIAKFKANATQGDTTQSIIKALTKIDEEIKNQAPLRGILSKKRGIKIRGVTSKMENAFGLVERNWMYILKENRTMLHR